MHDMKNRKNLGKKKCVCCFSVNDPFGVNLRYLKSDIQHTLPPGVKKAFTTVFLSC